MASRSSDIVPLLPLVPWSFRFLSILPAGSGLCHVGERSILFLPACRPATTGFPACTAPPRAVEQEAQGRIVTATGASHVVLFASQCAAAAQRRRGVPPAPARL